MTATIIMSESIYVGHVCPAVWLTDTPGLARYRRDPVCSEPVMWLFLLVVPLSYVVDLIGVVAVVCV